MLTGVLCFAMNNGVNRGRGMGRSGVFSQALPASGDSFNPPTWLLIMALMTTLQTCIQGVLGSKFGPYIATVTEDCCSFPQSLHETAELLLRK